MCATYRDKERYSNFESFANKILTGIKEIKPDYAERRAVWELFQNALDTIEENGEIRLERTLRGFKFIHNGKPFKDDHIGGLIKQYSSGKSYGENKNFVGQYGTGFISTHVYGKKITINGVVTTDDGNRKKLIDFDLDRTADDLVVLTNALLEQDNKIAALCDNEGNLVDDQYTNLTSFEYVANDSNITSVDVMFSYIHDIMPYIFCFNTKLSKVTIISNTTTLYSEPKFENGEFKLKKDGSSISFACLQDDVHNIKIILPRDGLKAIPKLFLFYPLMSTSNLGINFLIHAQEFKPNKERDYLHLENSNPDVKKDVQINEQLLETAFNLIISEIRDNSKTDFLNAANILLVENETPYEKALKIKYINFIKKMKRLEVNSNTYSVEDIVFFDEELLALDENILKSFYQVFSQFYSLMPYDQFVYISKLVSNWKLGGVADLHTVNIEEYCKVISEKSKLYLDNITHNEDFKSILKSISHRVDLLNDVPLIPNIHHQLNKHSQLVRWSNLEQPLVDVMDAINADVSATYLHKDYYFITNISSYDYEKYKTDLSSVCNNLNDQLAKNIYCPVKDDVKFLALTEWLNYFIGLNHTSQLNVDLHEFFCTNFNLIANKDNVENSVSNYNYQPAFKLLSRLYIIKINNLNSKLDDDSIQELLKLIKLLNGNTNLKDELLDKLECFPTQNYYLKTQLVLKKDEVIDKDFKDKYKHIVEKDVRDELVLSLFEPFLQHNNSITGLQLGEEIERKLNPEKQFFPIVLKEDDDGMSEENLKEVLDLIKYISLNPNTWGQWLPNINKVKEEILMHKFKDEKTRNSLFAILSESEDKINLLGNLAKLPNLQALIDAGHDKQKEQFRRDNHTAHIRKIGDQIQSLIEKQLDKELQELYKLKASAEDEQLKTKEEQNGQDFIIYKSGKPYYYIEVKSRWDSEGIVALSKRQVERCAKNKDRYAVVTVNVADYKSRNGYVTDDVTFEQLYDDIYVNTDLSDEFDDLVKTNLDFENINMNAKLIEFRGHIPQDRIKGENSVKFQEFIGDLKLILTS